MDMPIRRRRSVVVGGLGLKEGDVLTDGRTIAKLEPMSAILDSHTHVRFVTTSDGGSFLAQPFDSYWVQR